MGRALCYTIGYSGRSVDDFVAALKDARVDRVVDVRELPLSRRRGFSKTALGKTLAANGIEYVHLRAAGNPYRDQRQDVARCLDLYRAHIAKNPKVIDLVDDAIRGRRAALMCFEADACACHRSVIAEGLSRHRIRHL
jgi:uncharacterized protein (DUF488 family)